MLCNRRILTGLLIIIGLFAFSLGLAGVGIGAPAKASPSTTPAAPEKSPQSAETGKRIDLNTASQQELESLPGVGKISAKKIIAGRPYTTVDDLGKAGLSAKNLAAIKPLVTVSAAPAKAAPPSAPPKPPVQPASPGTPAPIKTDAAVKLAPGQMVNLNTASQEMLEALPEIGPVKAQAIIANRPYKKIEDITKVKGIKEGTFKKIKTMITVN